MLMLSLKRRPGLEAAAIAATRFGSAPLDIEWAIGKPSLEANNTPLEFPYRVPQSLRCDS